MGKTQQNHRAAQSDQRWMGGWVCTWGSMQRCGRQPWKPTMEGPRHGRHPAGPRCPALCQARSWLGGLSELRVGEATQWSVPAHPDTENGAMTDGEVTARVNPLG